MQGRECRIFVNFAPPEAQNRPANWPARGPRTPLQYIAWSRIGMCGYRWVPADVLVTRSLSGVFPFCSLSLVSEQKLSIDGWLCLCFKVGNHVDVSTGKWTAQDAGIGAGVDSYFEYLVKGAVLFQKPRLMKEFHGVYYSISFQFTAFVHNLYTELFAFSSILFWLTCEVSNYPCWPAWVGHSAAYVCLFVCWSYQHQSRYDLNILRPWGQKVIS